jgi:dihydroorotate dehydrogenase electron transfer subunit
VTAGLAQIPEAERRTLAPLGRRAAPVTAVKQLGAYVLIEALDASGPPDPRPGQFYMLAADRWGGGTDERPYLPRAFSFCTARPEAGGVSLGFLAEDVGPGTHRLCELEPGEDLLLTGPLGLGFAPPADGRRALLVGGGIGVAPVVAWRHALLARAARSNLEANTARGARAAQHVVIGFRTAAHAQAAALFEGSAEVVTEDGSAGRSGLVTEPLRAQLDADPHAIVYSCGPPAMLEAVRALCAEHEVPAQLALEAGMACGFGACFGCAVPTRGGYVRICVDGPVLDAAELETALIPGTGH